MAYYENNISKNASINALYYLGDNVSGSYENHEGGSAQQNDAHLIEFLAATAIVDFCNKEHPNTVNKELGLCDIKGSVTFNSFYDEQKKMLFPPLTEFIMMANCLTHKYNYYSSKSFNANNDNFTNIYHSSFMSNLRSMLQSYLEWLKEMDGNNRALSLFNLKVVDKPFDVVNDVSPKRIFSTKSDYDLVTDRLNSAIRKCNSKDECNKFLEMFYLATVKLIGEKFNV